MFRNLQKNIEHVGWDQEGFRTSFRANASGCVGSEHRFYYPVGEVEPGMLRTNFQHGLLILPGLQKKNVYSVYPQIKPKPPQSLTPWPSWLPGVQIQQRCSAQLSCNARSKFNQEPGCLFSPLLTTYRLIFANCNWWQRYLAHVLIYLQNRCAYYAACLLYELSCYFLKWKVG